MGIVMSSANNYDSYQEKMKKISLKMHKIENLKDV